jgi:hypothetical protein
MKPARGYFSTDLQGNVHWVESDQGMWLLCPNEGLRQVGDSIWKETFNEWLSLDCKDSQETRDYLRGFEAGLNRAKSIPK